MPNLLIVCNISKVNPSHFQSFALGERMISHGAWLHISLYGDVLKTIPNATDRRGRILNAGLISIRSFVAP